MSRGKRVFMERVTVRLSAEQMLWLSGFQNKSEAIKGLIDERISGLSKREVSEK